MEKGKVFMSTSSYQIIKNPLGIIADEIASHEKIYLSCKAMNALDENKIRDIKELINERKKDLLKAKESSTLPKKIYKFVSLDDNDCQNEKKFHSLRIDSIWFSCFNRLNDPYEFLASSLMRIKTASDISFGSSIGETQKQTEEVYEAFCKELNLVKGNMHIACFVDRANDNLPFWAHYAGNNRGFCLEYEIIEDIYLHEVKYVKSRVNADRMFNAFKHNYDEVKKLSNRETNAENSLNKGRKLQQTIRAPFTSFVLSHCTDEYITKHNSWEYEREYRILKLNDLGIDSANIDGGHASVSECGLRLIAIYCGVNCTKQHEADLKGIAESKGVLISRCEVDDVDFILFR